MRNCLLMACVMLSALLGCEKSTETHAQMSQKVAENGLYSASWAKLSSSNVVIKLGDLEITRRDFEDYVSMMRELLAIKFPKEKSSVIETQVKNRLPTVKEELISKLILQKGLSVTNSADQAKFRKMVEDRYVRMFSPRGKKLTFTQIAEQLKSKGLERIFMRNFEQDVCTLTAFKTTYADRLTVTEKEYQEVYRNVMEVNAIAKATNDLNYATATKLHAQLVKSNGQDFARLADLYSQDPEKKPGGDMGECDVQSLKFTGMEVPDFEQTKYWKTLNSLQEGEITPVLETDVGWEIVKLNSRVAATNANAGVESLHLSRIYFRRAYEFPRQSKEEFISDVKQEKKEIFLKEISEKVQKENKVEFPSGKAIFPAGKKAPPRGMKR